MEISIRICAVGLIILWIGQKSFGSASDGLLANGDFETSPEPSVLNGTVIIGDTSLPGWKIKGTVEYINEGQKQDSMILVVPQGTHAARLGNDAQISQEIELDKGSVYSFTFSSSRTCAQMEALNVSVPPATGNVDLQTLYSSQGWDAYAWAFQAESDKGEAIFLNPGLEEDPTCGLLYCFFNYPTCVLHIFILHIETFHQYSLKALCTYDPIIVKSGNEFTVLRQVPLFLLDAHLDNEFVDCKAKNIVQHFS